MINLTEIAAKKVTDLLINQPRQIGLRVGVRGGGCSGFTYFLEFAEEISDHDRQLESLGVKLVIDPKSYLYLMGMEFVFIDSLAGSGFKFNNPNARRTCGCGESFSI